MVAPVNGASRAGAAADRSAATSSWFTPAAVARAIGGEVVQRGRKAVGVATDTRGDCRRRLFVALRGDRYDAHRHVDAAVQNGAAGLIVDRAFEDLPPLPRHRTPFVIRVNDTGEALLELAAEHRRRHRAKVVGITGSCGKTSTKEWLGSLLAQVMPTVRSPASFNNHVGVPLTLFSITAQTRAAVVEIGTSGPGEIARLTEVVRPDIGIVTCVAAAHLAGLGTLEGVAREKANLVYGVPADGLCILNGDDASCRAMAADCVAPVEFTSVQRESHWFATELQFHAMGTTFLLRGERPVTVPGLGTHVVYNALAALAAAAHLGVAEDDVLDALAALPPTERRLEPKVAGGVTVYDDTYNMNPESARAALHALSGLTGPGRRIAVFGEMLELGDASESLHRELGRQVAATTQDFLVTVGAGAGPIADGAVAAGMARRRVHRVDDVECARVLLLDLLRPQDRVLCKASRRVALDRLVDTLVDSLASSAAAIGMEGA